MAVFWIKSFKQIVLLFIVATISLFSLSESFAGNSDCHQLEKLTTDLPESLEIRNKLGDVEAVESQNLQDIQRQMCHEIAARSIQAYGQVVFNVLECLERGSTELRSQQQNGKKVYWAIVFRVPPYYGDRSNTLTIVARIESQKQKSGKTVVRIRESQIYGLPGE